MDQRKRELKEAYLAAERKAKRQSFSLSVADLQDLFDTLDEQLEEDGCDHTLRLTTAWMAARQIDAAPVVPERGGRGRGRHQGRLRKRPVYLMDTLALARPLIR